eukprot:7383601-Prymnesium_polylepis.4
MPAWQAAAPVGLDVRDATSGQSGAGSVRRRRSAAGVTSWSASGAWLKHQRPEWPAAWLPPLVQRVAVTRPCSVTCLIDLL